MLRLAGLTAAVLALGGATANDGIPLPSGLTVTFLDVITDAPGLGLAYRFRFVAPELDPAQSYEITEGDMVHLCRDYALPRVEGVEPRPVAIVITLADRPVPFGEMAPEAVQFFEAYRPENGDCVWKDF